MRLNNELVQVRLNNKLAQVRLNKRSKGWVVTLRSALHRSLPWLPVALAGAYVLAAEIAESKGHVEAGSAGYDATVRPHRQGAGCDDVDLVLYPEVDGGINLFQLCFSISE